MSLEIDRLTSKEDWQFVQDLLKIKEVLVSREIEYVVVGGLALRAILGLPLQSRRQNGSIPDIDIIGLGPNKHAIEQVVNELSALRREDPNFPAVGLEPVFFGNREVYSDFEVLSGMERWSSGNIHLGYRGLRRKSPPESLKIVQREYGGVMIPTYCAETTFWRYFERGGWPKGKDLEKLGQLWKFVSIYPEEQISTEARRAHIEFISQIRKKYPLALALFLSYWVFDHAVGDRISGSKDFFYKFIPFFREK